MTECWSSSARGKRPGNKWRLGLSLVVSATLLGVVLWTVELSPLLAALGRAGWPALLLVLVISAAFNWLVYADRWRRMLGYLGYEHPAGEVLRTHLGTGPLRLLLPIQTGETISALALARPRSAPLGAYLGTLAYGKYLNLIATVGILVGGLAAQGESPVAGTSMVIATCGGILLVGLSLELRVVRQGIIRLASLLGTPAGDLTRDLFAVFAEVSPPRKLFLLLYSLLFQFSEVVVCWILFAEFGIRPPFPTLMVIVALTIIISSFPLTIAGTGTREALCLVLLTQYVGRPEAVAAGVLYSFVEYIFPMAAGFPWTRGVVTGLLPGREKSSPTTDP